MAKKGKGFFGAVGSFLGSIPAVKKVKKAAKSVKKKIKKAKKKLKKALKKAKKKLKKKLGKVLTKARKLKNNLSKSKLVKRFKKAVKKAVKKAKKYVKKVVKTVKKAVKTTVKAVKKAVKTTVKAVKKAVKTTVKAVKTAAKTTVKAVKTAAKTTVKAVKTATKAAVKVVKTAAKTAVKVAKSATKKAAVFVKSVSISQAISTVADFIPVVGNAKAVFETAFGFNPITGEKLSAMDRGISAAGILGGGFAKAAGKGGKATLNLFSKSKNATNATESAAKSSKNAASVKGDVPKGTGNVTSYPPRTSEATAKAQNVVGELNNILGDGKRAPNPVVSVITHKNGTVSVGFSGEASPKNIETARQLQNALNKKYGDKYTVKAEPMPTEKLDTIEGGNRVGNCAESKVVNAAHDNPSKITGMDTVWRSSKKENPYPYAENSNQMNPCLTCSDIKNIEEYMKYANANKK
ncbi:pre-toxin TG domain-containing protein [Lysinibacillus xylanilyticus]|uniref:pre-toxin TG domain-containing protein n=1 Tax=Lysinibacillus xylanilyticus TaxID=582475 RepID=UPI003D014D8A